MLFYKNSIKYWQLHSLISLQKRVTSGQKVNVTAKFYSNFRHAQTSLMQIKITALLITAMGSQNLLSEVRRDFQNENLMVSLPKK